MAERLWDKLQIEKEYEQDQQWEGGYGVSRESTAHSDAWDAEHEFSQAQAQERKENEEHPHPYRQAEAGKGYSSRANAHGVRC